MLVIIHGWSDSADSFVDLSDAIQANLGIQPIDIRLADYISLDDDVTYEDLRTAMQAAWNDVPALRAAGPRSVDAVVHSTGGLVIREWMTHSFRPEACPIHRLLMLAPANFGSPLAHKGTSFIGRVIKGFHSRKPFQTGEHILRGLELASPYSAGLAERDLFGGADWYGPGKVLATVLIGTAGYRGLAAIANEAGSDGTVRVSAANLNALKLSLNFAANPADPEWNLRQSTGRTAFLRIPYENHSTVAMKDGGFKNSDTLTYILAALRVTDETFEAHCDALDQAAEQNRQREAHDAYTQGYQNVVVHLVDDCGHDVTDFLFEAFVKTSDGEVHDEATGLIQEKVIKTVHCYELNKSYRSLLFNTQYLLKNFGQTGFNISITAMPDITADKNVVGYRTFGWDDIGSIHIDPEDMRALFRPDTTLLAQILIRREQLPELFRFRSLPLQQDND